ncbi:MAG: hypothetical protein ABUJ92_13240, partial [Desulfobacterales bacterium]
MAITGGTCRKMHNVEVSCGPDEFQVCTDLYDKPPSYTPPCRGEARRSEDWSAQLIGWPIYSEGR